MICTVVHINVIGHLLGIGITEVKSTDFTLKMSSSSDSFITEMISCSHKLGFTFIARHI